MKNVKRQKINRRSGVVLVLACAFFLMHHLIFLGNASSLVPLFESWVQPPYFLSALVHTEQVRPNYIKPFDKVTFTYWVRGSGEEIIEESQSIISHDLNPVKGDARLFFDPERDGPHIRMLTYFEYANWVFFFVQYSLLLAMIVVVTENRISERLFTR